MAGPGGSAFRRLLTRVLIRVWQRLDPTEVPRRPSSLALADNVQGSMNLIMPLRHPGPDTTAQLAQLLVAQNDALFTGLDNVGTVHFARFDIVDGKLCMISIYDGDFATYIRDFIVAIGDIFDALMGFVADPPPTPVQEHIDAFIDWVDARDLLQLPENLTVLSDDLQKLPRKLLSVVDQQPNVQLGVYRAYPGLSAAQVRQRVGFQW